jgi:predicted nucleotidyltransferase
MLPFTKVQTKLREQGAPESHLTRLADLVALAERDPNLLAVFLVGSYARGSGDRVSDLDLVAIAAPGHGPAVLQAAQDLLGGSNVLNQFTGTYPSGGSFWKLVYLDFSSVEFHVFEPSTAFRLKRPYLPVWDPANLLASYVVDGEPMRHEDFAAYEYGDEGLIWELVDCIKWLSRGRNELAKNHIKKLAAKMTPDASGG